MNEEKQKRYNLGIDFMRIVAIVGVILIHITTRTVNYPIYEEHSLRVFKIFN